MTAQRTPDQNSKYIDYHYEASEYEKKLIQVAEMHRKLLEFSENLQRSLQTKEVTISRLRAELILYPRTRTEPPRRLCSGSCYHLYPFRLLDRHWLIKAPYVSGLCVDISTVILFRALAGLHPDQRHRVECVQKIQPILSASLVSEKEGAFC